MLGVSKTWPTEAISVKHSLNGSIEREEMDRESGTP
jgi:hypothetical protein